MAIRTEFLSVASYAPPKVYTNDDLAEFMETSDEWIVQRTGIKKRRWIEGATSTSDLAFEASLKALEKAKVKKEELDAIFLATLSPDHVFPGTACFLQKKLGVPGIPAFDIRQQCTGFIYAMSIADQYIRNGVYKKVLVVGSEVHSKALDRTTRGRDVTVLFGDGAGAAVLGAKEVIDSKTESCLLSTHLHCDGEFAEELWVPAPGSGCGDHWCDEETYRSTKMFPQMNGKTVFIHAVKRMPEVIFEGLRANQLTPADIDLFILHQANLRINEMAAKALEVSPDKVFNTIEDYGNTTAATIPIGLDEAERAGRLKKGMLVASAAFGSGFTWASAIYRW